MIEASATARQTPTHGTRGLPSSQPPAQAAQAAAAQQAAYGDESQRIGRNDPCPCGSGKKYKHCHGQLAKEA